MKFQKRKVLSPTLSIVKMLMKISFVVLQVAVAFASETRSKPRYVSLKAQELYDEDLISQEEYSKSIHDNDRL